MVITKEIELSVFSADSLLEKGYSAGFFYVAKMFWSGIGKPQDYKKAFELMTIAAKGRFKDCHYGSAEGFLGSMYLHGWGTERDYKLAKVNLKRGVVNGDNNASRDLNNMDRWIEKWEAGYDFDFTNPKHIAKLKENIKTSHSTLQSIGEYKEKSAPFVPILISVYTNSNDQDLRRRLISVIKKINHPSDELFKIIRNIISQPIENGSSNLILNNNQRNILLDAISMSGEFKLNELKIINTLDTFTSNSDRLLRMNALWALSKIDTLKGSIVATKLVNDESAMVRSVARQILQN